MIGNCWVSITALIDCKNVDSNVPKNQVSGLAKFLEGSSTNAIKSPLGIDIIAAVNPFLSKIVLQAITMN